MTTKLQSASEVAQHFCDDVVLHADYFKPNAPGRFELSGLRAVSERQLLKSRGLYFAERVLLAVTPVEVLAIAMDAASFLRHRRIVWTREQLRIELVPCRSEQRDDPGPALHLSHPQGSPAIEVAPLVDDHVSAALIDYLLTDGRATATTPD